MRIIVATLLWGALWAPAAAQPGPSADDSQVGRAAPLVPGANSFMESQARAAIAAKGFADISRLVNDDQGIWRGTATRNGQKVHVSVDYKGHVDAQ
ncbi:MAG TPA: PepSY domain-containing protein [Rhodopseudomonas sp.]|uniref:PepSY domain-containing protein n=1 Tax=Rhodopseudomonas sp. TaxID=1078 RepID=UPI002ED8394B